MKYHSLFISILALCISILALCTGCFVSMQPKVSEEYLETKSEAETSKLEAIEQKIISITDSKNEVKKSIKETDSKIVVSEQEIMKLGGQKDLEKDKEAMKKLETEKLKLQYLTAKKENQEAQFKVKEAELGVSVAEQRFEEAKIGKVSQDKKLKSAGPVQKSKEEKIEVKKYQEYYQSQKENLASEQKDQKSAEAVQKKAEAKLKKSGYSGEF
ncbi:MAG: hypothetical protein GY754_23090 [bacterium]|nr:hypothetical protein [bacterium]